MVMTKSNNKTIAGGGKPTSKKLTPLISAIVNIALAHAVVALTVLVVFLFFFVDMPMVANIAVYGSFAFALSLFAKGLRVIFKLTRAEHNSTVASASCVAVIMLSPLTWFLVNGLREVVQYGL